MAFTISINEEAAFEVLFAGPAGPTGPQGIQGIQGVPGEGVAAGGTTGQVLKKLSATDYDTGWSSDISGVAWGAITGTLSSQTDLQNALDAKLSISAASSTYLPNSGGYITGDIQSSNGSGYRSWDGLTKTTVLISTYLQLNNSGAGGSALTVEWDGITFATGKQTLPFLGLTGYATESWVTSNFYPLVGNPSGFLTASALTPYSTTVQADALYYPLTGNPSAFLVSADLTGYATESWVTSGFYPLSGNPSAFLTDAPSDGSTYGRNNGAWAVAGGPAFIESVTSPLLVTGTDLSIDLTGYAVESWVTAGFYPLEGNPASFATEYFVTSQGYITQATADGLYYGISNPSGFITSGSLLPYAPLAGATFTGLLTVKASGGGGAGLLIPLGSNPTSPIDGEIWNLGSGGLKVRLASVTETLANQSWVTSQGYITSSALTPYALLAGATFTGKVNMAAPTAGSASLNLGVGTAPTTSVAGDIWIATNINFKASDGTQKVVANTNTSNTFSFPQIVDTTATTAALRVTQKGTGNAIQVEDSTTPDATPFVVDQFGKVGVGIAPDATAAIKVDANGISFNGLVFNPTATAAHTGGSDTLDLLVTINGTNYRIGLRPA